MATNQPVKSEEFVPPTDRDRAFGRRIVGWTRFIVILPVMGLFVGAITLVVRATIDMVKVVLGVISFQLSTKEALVKLIEEADIYLLSIVLYIMALGLFELFIDDRLPMPEWLVFRHLDDLKEKLISVVVVVMGVYFLGRVIEGIPPLELLYTGAGIAAVIGSLGYFVARVLAKGH